MGRKIAILGGTGAEGSGLAYRLAKAGEHILIVSREDARAQEAARLLRERIGGDAQIEGMDNPSAAAACDVAVLTVPFSGAAALLKQLKSVWKPGTIVIDTTVPLAATVGGAATRVLGIWQGSAAAFQNLGADVLASDSPVDCDVLVCSDDDKAKQVASELVGKIAGARALNG